MLVLVHVIIPTPHHYAYFAQIDWLEKLYTSVESRNYLNQSHLCFAQFVTD